MAPSELLDDVVERVVLADHPGMSGAALERVRLTDGRALLVKRIDRASDLTMSLVDGDVAPEYLLWRGGVLDRLPDGVSHAVVDGWVEAETTVIVMRDLGNSVWTWDDHLSSATTTWLVERVARLHRSFVGELSGDPPAGTVALDRLLTLFAPDRLRGLDGLGSDLTAVALRGWEVFAETVTVDVTEPVLALLADPAPLVAAMSEGPTTLIHGDLATVNMAVDGDDLVLLDWALPCLAPGAMDVVRLVAGCSSVMDLGREQVLDAWAQQAGPAHDEPSMRLALLSGLMWLGWNKALDAAEHSDLAVRAREQEDLDWWVAQARRTLESGAL